MLTHKGGCHCGRVRFEFDAPAQARLDNCNCSICQMSGYLHLIVDSADFRLSSDEAHLSCYTFNTGVAKHYFCTHCGIKSFYVPRSHPDGISVNARCIDPGTFEPTGIEDFDGANWEKNIHLLHQKS